MILEPFWRKVTENHQKSIGKTVFSQRVFATSKNLIKPMENKVFEKSKTRCENPYRGCRKLMILEQLLRKVTKNHQKALVKQHFELQKGSIPFKTLLQMSKIHSKKLLQDRPFAVKWTQKVQKAPFDLRRVDH